MGQQNLRVAFVDDDILSQKMVTRLLTKEFELNVDCFGTATDFLNCIQEEYDIVILDYNLPDMKGEQLLTFIQRMTKNVSVIVYSGQHDITVVKKMLSSNIHDYIVKTENGYKQLKESVELILNERYELSKILESAQILRKQIFEGFKISFKGVFAKT